MNESTQLHGSTFIVSGETVEDAISVPPPPDSKFWLKYIKLDLYVLENRFFCSLCYHLRTRTNIPFKIHSMYVLGSLSNVFYRGEISGLGTKKCSVYFQ